MISLLTTVALGCSSIISDPLHCNYTQIYSQFLDAFERGLPDAAFNLAVFNYYGIGTEKNFMKAKYYQKIINQHKFHEPTSYIKQCYLWKLFDDGSIPLNKITFSFIDYCYQVTKSRMLNSFGANCWLLDTKENDTQYTDSKYYELLNNFQLVNYPIDPDFYECLGAVFADHRNKMLYNPSRALEMWIKAAHRGCTFSLLSTHPFIIPGEDEDPLYTKHLYSLLETYSINIENRVAEKSLKILNNLYLNKASYRKLHLSKEWKYSFYESTLLPLFSNITVYAE